MSSSSGYCQGLQSCLEPPGLVEVPRVLRLKLAPLSNPNSSHLEPDHVVTNPDCDTKSNENVVDMVGWGFLQSLDNANSTSKSSQETGGNLEVYVHPTVKRSSSALTGKSLEMCTESLGSETGSDGGGDTSEEMALLCNLENENNYEPREIIRANSRETRRGVINRSVSFPPLLTSISGSTSFKMRSHREGGRLVMKAETMPSSRTTFQAERTNGRLRIHLFRDSDPSTHQEEEEAEAEEEADEAIVKASSAADDDENNWELEEETEVESEMGMGSLLARRWCKEGENGNKDILNWEPFWVAA